MTMIEGLIVTGIVIVAGVAIWFWAKWMAKNYPIDDTWWPECPEARIELRMARSITWDYGRFRYHLDRAAQLENDYLRVKQRAYGGLVDIDDTYVPSSVVWARARKEREAVYDLAREQGLAP